MHLFSSALQTEEMENYTQPGKEKVLKEGDLLKWQDMQFSLHGEVSHDTINEKLNNKFNIL